MESEAIVVMSAKKQKDLYNGFKAKIIRVKSWNVALSILEGPMKGEKRKALFATVTVVEDAPAKKPQISQAPAASAADEAALPMAATAAPALGDPPEDDEKPDEECMAMFGDLDLYG